MAKVSVLGNYADERGNVIYCDAASKAKVSVQFKGERNRLLVAADADVRDLVITFAGDDGLVELGPTTEKRAGLRFDIRLATRGAALIGENVGCDSRVIVRVGEGATVTIGADALLDRGVELRTHDPYDMLDVTSGKRVNEARSITIGEHVWLAKRVVVAGGVTIGSGSVITFGSSVTGSVPNNCVASGSPATIARRDVAWIRPETVHREPGERYPRDGERIPAFWNVTRES